MDWNMIFNICRKNLKDVKIIDFQYKFLHKIIYTKKELLIMKLVDNTVCSFCNVDSETLCHVYWECNATQIFWKELENWIIRNIQNFEITKTLVWFGVLGDKPLLNHIIFSAKRHIYTCALKKIIPKMDNFLKVLKDIYIVEKFIARRNNDSENFSDKWFPISSIFKL